MAKDFIVAIELGSSKITGVAGKRNADRSINVLAIAQENSSGCIRRGYVYNIDKTAQAISDVVTSLSNQLKCQIRKVYAGIGGQSIRGVKNNIVREFPVGTKITQNMVFDLMDANRATRYPEQEILDVAVQEYKVDNQYQIDPVGIECTRFEGSFLNIISRQSFYRNLNNCFTTAGVPLDDVFLSPIALADVVLTDAERRSGCVLVDMGADTTTVAVYYKNILRHLAVIPLGGNNITKDITSLQMDETDAEQIKLKYGSAYTESSDIDTSLKYSIDTDRNVNASELVEVIEARLEEIIENVKSQIPTELEGKLMGGYILTGGGSKLRNIEVAMNKMGRVGRVRIAKSIVDPIFAKVENVNIKDATLNTVLGILARGRENCAGDEINPGELFNSAIAPVEETPVSETQKPEVEERVVERLRPVPDDVEEDDEKDRDDEPRKKDNSKSGFGKFIDFIKGMMEDE